MRRPVRSRRIAFGVTVAVVASALIACGYEVPSVTPIEDAASRAPDGATQLTDGGDAQVGADGSPGDAGADAPRLDGESGADSSDTVVSDSTGSAPPSQDAPTPSGCGDAGILFVGESDAGSTTASQTFALPVPMVQEGDLLLAFVSYASATTAPALSPPNGWTGVGGQTSAGVSTFEEDSLYTGMHVATAAEPAMYTFSASTGTYFVGWMVAYRGVSSSDPIAMGAFAASSISAAGEQPINPPTLPAQAGQVVVAAFAVHPAGATGVTLASPPGLTLRAAVTDGSARAGYTGDVSVSTAQTVGPFQIDSPAPTDPTRATVLAELFSLRGRAE